MSENFIDMHYSSKAQNCSIWIDFLCGVLKDKIIVGL